MTEEPKVYNSIQEALLDVAKEGKKKYNESMSAPVIIPNWEEPKVYNSIQNGSRQVPCPDCLNKIYEILKND